MAVWTPNPFKRNAKRMRNALRRFRMRVFSRHARLENKAVFISFGGRRYAGSPRCISEALHEAMPDLSLIWLFLESAADSDEIPDYVERRSASALGIMNELANARVWVADFELPTWVTKREGQLYIQTYHGDRGFKTFLYSATPVRDLPLVESAVCDYIVTGSTFAEKSFRKAFRYWGDLLQVGCPRNDVLFAGNEEPARKAKTALGIPAGTQVLLYAPTFRDGLVEPQPMYGLNLARTLDALENRTGEAWVCMVRKHPSSKGIDLGDSAGDARIVDASEYQDANQLMLAADFMVSDYSSTICDFALLRRPMLLYVADHEDYSNLRSGEFSLGELPFWKAFSQEDVEALVAGMSEASVRQNCDEVLRFYGIYEDGCATERVVSVIGEFLASGEKPKRPPAAPGALSAAERDLEATRMRS